MAWGISPHRLGITRGYGAVELDSLQTEDSAQKEINVITKPPCVADASTRAATASCRLPRSWPRCGRLPSARAPAPDLDRRRRRRRAWLARPLAAARDQRPGRQHPSGTGRRARHHRAAGRCPGGTSRPWPVELSGRWPRFLRSHAQGRSDLPHQRGDQRLSALAATPDLRAGPEPDMASADRQTGRTSPGAPRIRCPGDARHHPRRALLATNRPIDSATIIPHPPRRNAKPAQAPETNLPSRSASFWRTQ